MSNEVDAFLAHYGVKGMKWGVRKTDQTSSPRRAKESKPEKLERKAKKYDDRADYFQQQIDQASVNRGKNWYQKRATDRRIKELTEYRDTAIKDAELKRSGKLSTGQKRALIGAGVALTVLAAYGTYKMADGGEFARMATKGKNFLDGNASPWKQNELLSRKGLSPTALKYLVVEPINRGYGEPGTVNNCRRATFAYEMRRRGYDVKATRAISGTGQNAAGLYNALNPGAKISTSRFGSGRELLREQIRKETGRSNNTPFSDLVQLSGLGQNKIPNPGKDYHQSIFDALSKQPNGARGEFGMKWKMGGAHSMVWEIVGGKPVIFDAQRGASYYSPSELLKVAESMSEAGFTRLDNIPLNEDFLMRWVQNA